MAPLAVVYSTAHWNSVCCFGYVVNLSQFHVPFHFLSCSAAATANFKNPTTVSQIPPYEELYTSYGYMTMKATISTYPCNKVKTGNVLRVGNESSCKNDDSRTSCNGPLPSPGPYRQVQWGNWQMALHKEKRGWHAEAKRVWVWSVPGWETPGKERVACMLPWVPQ